LARNWRHDTTAGGVLTSILQHKSPDGTMLPIPSEVGMVGAKLVAPIRNQQKGPSMAKISIIGLDLAKNVSRSATSMLRGKLCCDVSCGVRRWISFSLNYRRQS
jgi:hypothetical protein